MLPTQSVYGRSNHWWFRITVGLYIPVSPQPPTHDPCASHVRLHLHLYTDLAVFYSVVRAFVLLFMNVCFAVPVAMIAEGCIMARICHTNNCPVGECTNNTGILWTYQSSLLVKNLQARYDSSASQLMQIPLDTRICEMDRAPSMSTRRHQFSLCHIAYELTLRQYTKE